MRYAIFVGVQVLDVADLAAVLKQLMVEKYNSVGLYDRERQETICRRCNYKNAMARIIRHDKRYYGTLPR